MRAAPQQHDPRIFRPHNDLWCGPKQTFLLLDRAERRRDVTSNTDRKVMRNPWMPHEHGHSSHFMARFPSTGDGVEVQGRTRCLHPTVKHHPMKTVRPSMAFGAVLKQVPTDTVHETFQPKPWGGRSWLACCAKVARIGQHETSRAGLEQPPAASAPPGLWGHALLCSGLPA